VPLTKLDPWRATTPNWQLNSVTAPFNEDDGEVFTCFET
jgi:hypothetical protein